MALAAAGCGLGTGESSGDVSLTLTRDFGAVRLSEPVGDRIVESDTVMRVLDRHAEISTRYGGAFVHSIDGLEGGRRGGRSHDWFFYVNGLWSPVGAAEYALSGGEAIWWDYRDWSASTRVSALVGSWPQPFVDGYEGSRHPTAVECRGAAAACTLTRRRLRDAGASMTGAGSPDAIRVLVGPWDRVRDDPVAATLESGPEVSGIYAEFVTGRNGVALVGLDEGGGRARRFGRDAGLVAATREGDAPPVWIVSGVDASGALAAAKLLGEEALRDRFAVASAHGRPIALPVENGAEG